MKGCRCESNLNHSPFSKSCTPLAALGNQMKEHEHHRNQAGAQVECNYMCSCHRKFHCRRNSASSAALNCGRRQVQNGCQVPLEIIAMEDGRGFGVKTLSSIPKGTFVAEYVGEIISEAENIAREQKKNSAEFYTWQLSNGFVIDATKFRNVAAFINHQCKYSNLVPVKVLVNHQRPRVAFFAQRDIDVGEELTINYWTGIKRTTRSGFGNSCLCSYCKSRPKQGPQSLILPENPASTSIGKCDRKRSHSTLDLCVKKKAKSI